MPFFQGLYDYPGPGVANPNYDLELLGNYAVTRCKCFDLGPPLSLFTNHTSQTTNQSLRIHTIFAASSGFSFLPVPTHSSLLCSPTIPLLIRVVSLIEIHSNLSTA